MAIITVLAALATVGARNAVTLSREATLKEDLFRMRDAIDQYYADKGKYPADLQALVTDQYMREVPVDPISQVARQLADDPGRARSEQPQRRPGHLQREERGGRHLTPGQALLRVLAETAGRSRAMRRGDYGFDAPYALLAFLAGGIACVTFAGVAWWRHAPGAIAPLSLYAAFFLANAGSFLYTTRRGKFEEWDRILDGLSLAGTERVLDMGCGRGAVLTAVARRLTTGRVTGIDIWNTQRSVG